VQISIFYHRLFITTCKTTLGWGSWRARPSGSYTHCQKTRITEETPSSDNILQSDWRHKTHLILSVQSWLQIACYCFMVGISLARSFVTNHRLYILESNPHPFYSFRGLKNQMRIRIECGLDSRSRTGFWKNDKAGVCAIRTIQLFIILFLIYNILKYL
jgi:hypothetical protein